jgi:exopolysaccharide biosynthesis polyprenyl glycosylphosphotransferase
VIVADALFSPKRLPFVLLDFAVVSYSFLLVAVSAVPTGIGPHVLAAALSFSSAFAITALGIGFYDRLRRFEWSNIVGGSLVAVLTAWIVSFGYLLWQGLDLGVIVLVKSVTAAFLAVVALHLVLGVILRNNPYRFTTLGSSPHIEEVRSQSRRSSRRWRTYSHVPWEQLSRNGDGPTAQTLRSAGVSEVVLTNDLLQRPDQIDLAIRLLQLECRVTEETAFYTQFFERFPIETITRGWILERGIARRKLFTGIVKRTFDILTATFALIVLSPLLLFIAIAIKVSSRGPVLFVQERQGRHSVPFSMYKFRTMHTDCGSATGQAGFTRDGDERVTWTGRLLRPFHLDELPQLWNVIRGQMSLVGPRPEALSFAERMNSLIPLYELRYLARPGLTGYAQINQGYAMDSVVDTKLKLSYDLYYLCNHTLWTDLHIMIRTIFVLARRAR